MEECRRIGHCPTGKAVATTAGNLPAKKVIHSVGPVWKGGANGEEVLLRSCLTESLELAAKLRLLHLAIPAISTGVYGYPLDKAATTSIQALQDFLKNHAEGSLRRVTFVLFDSSAYQIFQDALFSLFPED